jgi:hypothetical protein
VLRELAGLASFYDVFRVFYGHWPIETLLESFSGQCSHCNVRAAHPSMDFSHELDALILRNAFE